MSARSTSPLRTLLRRPLGTAALIVLAVLVVVAVLGEAIAPHDPDIGSLAAILAPPSAEHLLGGDSAGRDVFSRMVSATRVTLAAALLAVVTALVLGVIGGLISGYFRGWFSAVATWWTTLLMAMPAIVVLLAARAALGPSVWLSMLVLGVLISPTYFRLVHAAVSEVREELYIDAARVAGLNDSRIIARHVLSVVRAPIIVQSSTVAGVAIAVQSGLEFLGLGDLAQPTWGSLLNDGFANLYTQPLLVIWPSIAIAVACLALALLANALRDALERTPSRTPRRRANAPQREPAARAVDAASTDAAEDAALPGDEVETLFIHPDDEVSRSRVDAAAVLEIRDLRVAYGASSEIEVVHGVSLDIRSGEVHGLIGESGSGKSQTAFAVLRLLSKGGRITDGTIRFDGADLSSAAALARVRGSQIGYIPQEPMTNLDPAFTIGFQLVEPLRTHLGSSRKRATARALELLDRVGIADPERTFRSYPHEISGGMAQRVLIAGAVATDPDLIIADEPTTALDVTVQADVLDLLRDLQEERGMAMLLVTHNFGLIADLCDRVTVMRDGRFVEQGPVRAILRDPAHPYTRTLLDSLLEGGPARGPLRAG